MIQIAPPNYMDSRIPVGGGGGVIAATVAIHRMYLPLEISQIVMIAL